MLAGLKIRILIANDHNIIRQGLVRLLQGCKDLAVVGEAAGWQQTLELCRRVSPDVVIMDVNMPGITGSEPISALKKEFPHIKIISLSAGEELPQSAALRAEGAVACFSKSGCLDALVAAIRGCKAGAA